MNSINSGSMNQKQQPEQSQREDDQGKQEDEKPEAVSGFDAQHLNDINLLLDHATRINLAIDAVNMAWWELNLISGAVIFHKRKAEMLGYDPGVFKHYQDFMNLVHPDDYETAMDAMRDHMSGKAATYEVEYRIKTVNGNYLWFQDAGTITKRDENGRPLRIVGFVIDITKKKAEEAQIRELNTLLEQKVAERTKELMLANEQMRQEIETRKQAEERSEQALRIAERANQSKSEFMSRMSHELRTPLNSILGFAQLLELGTLNEKQQRGVRHILSDGKKLLQLINEVLDITNIETGSLALSMEPVRLKSIFEEITEEFEEAANRKNVSLNQLISPTEDPFVMADYQRIKKLISILVDNAVRYNLPGGSVLLKTEEVPGVQGHSPQIKISVIDTGPGIKAEYIPLLFKPFERVDVTHEGTGLGLALAQKLTDAMNGSIGVESLPDLGSTFWISFAKTKPGSNLHDQPEPGHSAHQANNEFEKKILYIEDNESSSDLVANVLADKMPHLRLISSRTGKNIKNLIMKEKPDLILLDLDLPDIHGSELLHQFKQDDDTKAIPVVIISANLVMSKQKLTNLEGAVSTINKPLDIITFVDTLKRLL